MYLLGQNQFKTFIYTCSERSIIESDQTGLMKRWRIVTNRLKNIFGQRHNEFPGDLLLQLSRELSFSLKVELQVTTVILFDEEGQDF